MQRQLSHMPSTLATRLGSQYTPQMHGFHLRPTGISLRYCSTSLHRPLTSSPIASSIRTRRGLSTTLVVRHSPTRPVQSTALLEKVKQSETAKEDEVGQKLQEGGKGTEGAHYKGKLNITWALEEPQERQPVTDSILPPSDSQGISPVFDLADPSQTGAWTLSHPIYTEQASQFIGSMRFHAKEIPTSCHRRSTLSRWFGEHLRQSEIGLHEAWSSYQGMHVSRTA